VVKVQGAVIKEQDVTFAIVVVNHYVMQSYAERDKAHRSLSTLFPGMPVIFMFQDSNGVPEYWGHKDIVDSLADVHPSEIPWQEYTFGSEVYA
jgi:hypothetical protein